MSYQDNHLENAVENLVDAKSIYRPICLVVDNSVSLFNYKEDVNKAMKIFVDILKESGEPLLVSTTKFGQQVISEPFQPIENYTIVDFTCDEKQTKLYQAIAAGNDVATQLLDGMKHKNISVRKPLYIIITDGAPTTKEYQDEFNKFKAAVANRKCYCIAIAIGDNADTSLLKEIATGNKVLKINPEELKISFKSIGDTIVNFTRTNINNEAQIVPGYSIELID